MYKTICEMIEKASREEDYELIECVARLVEELATTINAPSNWRNIGNRLYKEYGSDNGKQWVVEELRLWDYWDYEPEE